MSSTGTCIDTNVLLDLLVLGAEHAHASVAALDQAALRGPLVIGPVTYAELATHYHRSLGGSVRKSAEELDLFLHEAGIRLVAPPAEAALTAGIAYARHLGDRTVDGVACAGCGEPNAPSCRGCGAKLRWRPHILTDFLVGAHALHTTGVLLTRDRHLHRKIPGLKLVAP